MTKRFSVFPINFLDYSKIPLKITFQFILSSEYLQKWTFQFNSPFFQYFWNWTSIFIDVSLTSSCFSFEKSQHEEGGFFIRDLSSSLVSSSVLATCWEMRADFLLSCMLSLFHHHTKALSSISEKEMSEKRSENENRRADFHVFKAQTKNR